MALTNDVENRENVNNGGFKISYERNICRTDEYPSYTSVFPAVHSTKYFEISHKRSIINHLEDVPQRPLRMAAVGSESFVR